MKEECLGPQLLTDEACAVNVILLRIDEIAQINS